VMAEDITEPKVLIRTADEQVFLIIRYTIDGWASSITLFLGDCSSFLFLCQSYFGHFERFLWLSLPNDFIAGFAEPSCGRRNLWMSKANR
jgi:hypothetical protein